jgi:hypothetical protein
MVARARTSQAYSVAPICCYSGGLGKISLHAKGFAGSHCLVGRGDEHAGHFTFSVIETLYHARADDLGFSKPHKR